MVDLMGLILIVGGYAAVMCVGLCLIGVATGGAGDEAAPSIRPQRGTEPAADAVATLSIRARGDHGHPDAPHTRHRPRQPREARRPAGTGGVHAAVPAHLP